MVRDDSALLAAMLSRWLSCARSTLSAAARQRSDGAGRADAELPVSTLWYLEPQSYELIKKALNIGIESLQD